MDKEKTVVGPIEKEPTPSRLAHDVAQLRGNLDEIVDELDTRRRAALDWRYQLKKNPLVFAIAGGAVVLLIVASAVSRAHTRPSARGPSVAGKLLASLGTTAIGILGRVITSQLMPAPQKPALPQRT